MSAPKTLLDMLNTPEILPSEAPITEDTVFHIGSVTKTLTAIAVIAAVGAGADRTSTRPRTRTCAPSG
jgi:hypothetical protein